MNGKNANHVLRIVVLLFLPVLLQAQELTADYVIHRANGEETRGKLYRGKDAVRLETTAEGRGAGKGTVVIYDLARQLTYFLNPAMKVYAERPGSAAGGPIALFVPQKDNPCALLPRVSAGGTCQKSGTETVNGRTTERWEATQTRRGKTIREYAWVDSDWHIAIKWQTEDQDIGQLENIHPGRQPAGLFVLPADYRKVEMPTREPSNL